MSQERRPPPSPVTCPRCGTVFLKGSGFTGHKQHAKCWKAVREAEWQQLQQLQQLQQAGPTRFPIPPRDPHWYLTPEFERCFARWDATARRGEMVEVVLVGLPGAGKTATAREFAARTGRAFFDVAASLWTDAGDSAGRDELKRSETQFQLAAWLEFLEGVPGGVLLLDELNRVQDTRALNVLLPFLDDRGAAFIEPLRREVRRAAGTIVFATMNRDTADPALSTLPPALCNRADFVRCEPLSPETEALILASRTPISATKAQCLAKFAALLRQAPVDRRVPISLRQLLRLANVAATEGTLSLLEAVRTTIAYAFDQDDEGLLAQHILRAAQMTDWTKPPRSVR